MAVLFILIAIILAGIALVLLGKAPEGEIRSGVSVGPIDLGGKTADQAESELARFIGNYELTFVLPETQSILGPFNNEVSPVKFDSNIAIELAYGVGRSKNPFVSLVQRLKSATFGLNISIPFSLDETLLLDELTTDLGTEVRPAEDASLHIVVEDNGQYDISVQPEKAGINFDQLSAIAETRDRLRQLSDRPIELTISTELPHFTTADLEPLVPSARTSLELAPRTVRARSLTWTVSRRHIADWLMPTDDGGQIHLTLNQEKVFKHLETYASSMAVSPTDAIFEMTDGRVTKFSPSIDGEKLDLEKSYEILLQELSPDAEPTSGAIELPVTVAYPDVPTEKSNPYGIKEILGIGSSNFKGSPANRRHNIALGSSSLNGLLVAPDDVFSLIGALGEIDGEHGYLPELVIKDNKTTPEFGGGLCQIGTTTFRTVLAAGLPVTERRNHSYRVSYYERDGNGDYMGPGKDATIYDPSPDFKFTNDTGHYILIMTNITGDKISFTFWGVSDGRRAEQTDAVILSQTSPPPKKVILTTDLPVGQEKCTEHAHAGAKAVFTYTVTMANGEIREEDIFSQYKPWQEVCLLGATAEDIVASQEQAVPTDGATTSDETPSSDAPTPPPEG
ncbi:hypothetical protein A2480_02850 [Candidatus Uhrbacteria bacterium RIFOXYC2_FULL_47_19]|uniref:YoaR-like putative peptidoglycan binding domain-containing protein n=1 Tax=Candidatus Uhrbacteria bacterium RIFOXYC2_FULL_47_19 TaxID=1802424 RepID=A0A1F7WEV3_9BACT|nr:MAG: hypothetical protein A2480_02850 [Candidatus Uhrbacteria bacterium RIFOXYC2_FULL_47_19]